MAITIGTAILTTLDVATAAEIGASTALELIPEVLESVESVVIL